MIKKIGNEPALTKDGDCGITITRNRAQIVCAIDDNNLKIMHMQQVEFKLGEIKEKYKTPNDAFREVFELFAESCKNSYNFSDEEINEVLNKINNCVNLTREYDPFWQNTYLNCLIILSCFFDFRKNILGIEEKPKFFIVIKKQESKDPAYIQKMCFDIPQA
jgi:hypothetical protein